MSVGSFNSLEMGQRIRELRKKQGLTQTEVADSLHIKRETLSTIEGGTRMLRDQEIVQLAKLLDTSCDYLLTGISSENLDVYKTINLSNQAIENLKTWSQETEKDVISLASKGGAIMTGLNYLLVHGENFLYLFAHYLMANYHCISLGHKLLSMDQIELQPDVLENALILKLGQEVKQIKEKLVHTDPVIRAIANTSDKEEKDQ